MEKTIVVTTSNIDQFNLGEERIYDQVVFVVEFLTEGYSPGDVYRFLRKLEPLVNKKKMPTDLSEKYQALIIRLKYFSLPILEPNETSELIKHNLLYPFKNSFDLKDRIYRMFSPESVDRQDLSTKNGLVQAIETNEERIGTNTVGGWLKEYKKTTGENAPGTLELVKFITENKSAVLLNDDAKTLLKEVLSFYDWLRYRSIDVAGVLGINQEQQRPISAPLPKFTPPKPAISMTAFEKKLAQTQTAEHGEPASTRVRTDLEESTRGGDLKSLKNRIEAAKVKEAPKSGIKMDMDEINREVKTKELPAHKGMIAAVPKPVIPLKPVRMVSNPKPVAPLPSLKPIMQLKPVMSSNALMSMGKPLTEINSMDDLKNIDVKHLRQGPVAAQLELIKTKIMDISHASKVLPFYAVAAFEQSPLFRAYLAAGTSLVSGGKSELTQQEFEAVADLKKQIESL